MAVELGQAEALRETTDALLVRLEDEDGREVWFPKTQIDDESEVWKAGQEGELVVSDWIAEKKGFV